MWKFIYYFDGDANIVKIGSMSAGGQRIQVHLMAPSSWPFFNNAISMSEPEFHLRIRKYIIPYRPRIELGIEQGKFVRMTNTKFSCLLSTNILEQNDCSLAKKSISSPSKLLLYDQSDSFFDPDQRFVKDPIAYIICGPWRNGYLFSNWIKNFPLISF